MTTTDRERLPGLDLRRFVSWFDGEHPGGRSADLTASVVAGGRSNLTYVVTDGTRRWVVRRPPLGHVLATAHDMAREYRVISALRATDVPVPATYGLCEDADVLGAPFYVMEHVEGTPYRWAHELAKLGPERTAAIGNRLVDVLAKLHTVDPASVGLADFGRPEGFLARQVRRWKKQLDASYSREIPGIRQLHEGLAVDPPETSEPAIVHGDYRLDNVLVDSGDRIAAVLDWEMATLGDPLADVALLTVYQRSSGAGLGDVVATVTEAPGWPSEAELLQRYADLSGRDLSHLGFHIALAAFKLAVILEGIHYRHVHGQTVGAGFDQIGQMVEPLVAIGLDALKEKH
ncbi:phosphotransferase family protein [Streptomyces somaliensis]|uniref:phosphotransferase family protein n=1 Tax=Streptomyces somaliensis TaxID=78355 RepID=UPI0034E96098|nr:phosphotransferase family protein [Streptomyces somaliensis]